MTTELLWDPSKVTQYHEWALMVRSDMMTHDQVHDFMRQHPGFRNWYLQNYISNDVIED